MKKICVDYLMIGESTFVPKKEYVVKVNPNKKNSFLVTDNRGIAIEIPSKIVQQWFL